jgi:hypothetical protein
MGTSKIVTNSELFQQYLEKHKDQVRDKSSEEFYHVNVVAEAYNQGFKDGEKSKRKDIIDELVKKEIEHFTQKANQIYILSNRIISHLNENSYKTCSLHLNLTFQRPSVIIAVPADQLVDDEFINIAYSKMLEIKEIYTKLFNEYLDIGLVSSENLDEEMLLSDGFGYKEVYFEKEKTRGKK